MTVPRAGTAYFALVFAVAFGLGVLRTLVLAPRVGDLTAVALEVPLLLLWSWVACGLVLSRWPVPPRPGPRLAMGGVAFALLMAAELALSAILGGRSPSAWLASLLTPPGALGLGGQVLFALVPVLRR